VVGADREALYSSRVVQSPLNAPGLDWTLRAAPSSEWLARRPIVLPWVVLLATLALAGSLTWYIRSLEARRLSLSHANAELYTEVAERHSIEKELRETQRAMSTLVANLPGLAYRSTTGPERHIEFISDGCIQLTGWTPSEFLTGRVSFASGVVDPDDQRYVSNAVQQALEAHRPFQLVYRIRTKLGDAKWCWEQGRGVYSRAGERRALDLTREIEAWRDGLASTIAPEQRIEFELARDLPPVSSGAAGVLRALGELLRNASEAAGDSAAPIHVATGALQVDARGSPRRRVLGRPIAGRCVYVSVRDEGEGMAESVRARAGESGFSTKPTHLGLGLAAAIECLRSDGAWLELESELGRGATATIFFPLGTATG
jgi:signal transduction histidine kinase